MQSKQRAKRRAVVARIAAEDNMPVRERAMSEARQIVERIAPHCRVELDQDTVVVLRGDERIGMVSIYDRLPRGHWLNLRQIAKWERDRIVREARAHGRPTKPRVVAAAPRMPRVAPNPGTTRHWLIERTLRAIARVWT